MAIIPVKEVVSLKKKFPMIQRHVDRILIDSLSPTQKKLYNWMTPGKEIDTKTVAIRHDAVQTSVSEALRDLFNMGLIRRKQVTTGTCRKYLYWKGGE